METNPWYPGWHGIFNQKFGGNKCRFIQISLADFFSTHTAKTHFIEGPSLWIQVYFMAGEYLFLGLQDGTVMTPVPLPLLSCFHLISSSFLFPVDFSQGRTTSYLLFSNPTNAPFRVVWQIRKPRHQILPKGTHLCGKEWSPQFSSIWKQNPVDCTSSEQIIERRDLGDSQGSPSMTFMFLITRQLSCKNPGNKICFSHPYTYL